MENIVDDAFQILDRPASLRHVAVRAVAPHFGIPSAPKCLWFWIQPNDPAGALVDPTHDVCARVAVVGSRITEDDHSGAAIDGVCEF